ncbi:glycosyltransferase family 4 protein [Photobacterium phosphoreum]|uniref:glycosyltransferase family 4 protein n=1 Tax=Photobacterium phosphoreum TaxID=659 RepID=UPI001E2BB141|nr:glycosyltransferase family 4 protein [Photobacterium phosphoreum]MCD9511828.1 glycosyltransferase [Photobacterium phosphoreum]
MEKIVFFAGSLNASGGTERVSTIIANRLSEIGYTVQFLSLHDGNNPFFRVNDDIKIDTLFDQKLSFKKHYHKVIFKLRRYLKDNNVDILINIESMLALYSVPACIGLNIRNICWEHFNFHVDLGLKLRKIARQVAAVACDDIITLTETDRKFWLENTVHKAKITAISNPALYELIRPRDKIHSKVVLSAGRLTHQKGFDLLLQSWALVIKQRTDWTLRIVGSGEEHDALKYQAEKLGISQSIQWVSHVNNMFEQYNNADLYVMSSRFEGLPMVLLEAISAGLPLVSFDCKTGPREIIEPTCGWLVEDGNISMLSEKLLEAFTTFDDDDQYYAFSKAAINKCQTEFSLEPIINKWVRLIENKK